MRFDTRMYRISSILSILTLIGTVLAIGILSRVFFKIVYDHDFIETKTFENKFGVLTEGLKTNITYKRGLILTHKGFYLGRWALTVAIMIFFRDQSLVQIGFLLFISAIT